MEFKKVEKLPIDIKNAVEKRVSTRSYEERALTEEDRKKLMDFNEILTNTFNVDINVQYISKENGADDVKLGTYGTIKGAKDF